MKILIIILNSYISRKNCITATKLCNCWTLAEAKVTVLQIIIERRSTVLPNFDMEAYILYDYMNVTLVISAAITLSLFLFTSIVGVSIFSVVVAMTLGTNKFLIS